MADCTVTCDLCRTDQNTPRVWHWLCEECATECADQHRQTTNHPVHLNITVEPTMGDIMKTCQVAAMLSHRRRFW